MAAPAPGERTLAKEEHLSYSYHFFPWLLHRKRALIPVLLIILRWWGGALSWISQVKLDRSHLNGLQAETIVILLILSLHPISKPTIIGPRRNIPDEVDRKCNIAAAAVKRFYFCWLGLLASWLAFYLIASITGNDAGPLFNVVNASEAVFLFLAYSEMASITLSGESRPEKSAKRRVSWVVAVFCTLAVWQLFTQTSPWWSLVSGLTVGVSLALLVGRFESRYIAAPLLVNALCFFYAALQVTYPLFQRVSESSYRELDLIATVSSLPLKILLFLVVDWMYAGGKLFFYMFKERELLENGNRNSIEEDWKHFWPPGTLPSN